MVEQRNRCGVKDLSCFVLNDRCRIVRFLLSSKSMLLIFAVVAVQFKCFTNISGYQIHNPVTQKLHRNRQTITSLCIGKRVGATTQKHPRPLFLSADDWSSFQAMDDDDEIVFGKVLDKQDYAVENDSQDEKEAVGALRPAPTIEQDADPISVPAGTTSVTNTKDDDIFIPLWHL